MRKTVEMEERTKSFLFWVAVCILCFVGIPIHFKGDDSAVLQEAFQNFTVQFNRSYNAKQYKEKYHNFKVRITVSLLSWQWEISC